MKHIFVLAEHRKQQLRDTTWEAIAAGRKLASDLGAQSDVPRARQPGR